MGTRVWAFSNARSSASSRHPTGRGGQSDLVPLDGRICAPEVSHPRCINVESDAINLADRPYPAGVREERSIERSQVRQPNSRAPPRDASAGQLALKELR